MEQQRIKLHGVLIVEGKYDQITLSNLVDGLIIPTHGFRIFKQPAQRAMIRRLGETLPLFILTDSDVAGMKIRNYLGAIAPEATIHHLYIPKMAGKESRKRKPSKEGTLGVEGMTPDLLRSLLEGAMAAPKEVEHPVTKEDLYLDGYMGGTDSRSKRKALLQQMKLPSELSTNALLRMVNLLMTRAEYEQATQFMDSQKGGQQ